MQISFYQHTTPQWVLNLQQPHLSKDTATLGITTRSLFESVDLYGLAVVDKYLANVDVLQASPSHLVCVISSLFSYRFVLQHWSTLRDNAVAHYRSLGMNVDKALKGLI